MKQLEYLNLALNNIEVIENLEGCESLRKLDLTLNFIGELTSVENLKHNIHLESLYLTGNPCTDFEGYREYVVATLGQLKYLDNIEIQRSERIKALQRYEVVRNVILREQRLYRDKRSKQKKAAENSLKTVDENSEDGSDSDIETKNKFWSEMSENTPETRIEIAKKSRKKKGNKDNEIKEEKRVVKLFSKDGKPLNVNEARIPFHFLDEEELNRFILDVHVYRHLDTELLDVDIQPTYVKVVIKGKVFQMTLNEEINVEQSSAQRSQTTGHLVITMPKANGVVKSKKLEPKIPEKENVCNDQAHYSGSKREFLEIGPPNKDMDFSNIVNMKKKQPTYHTNGRKYFGGSKIEEKLPPENFVDDPEVPALG